MHKWLSKTFLGSLMALAAMTGTAAAQYQSIPNFTGIGAGFNFRQAINQRFSGAQPIAPQIAGLPFASLPAQQNGLLLLCKDCQATTPCSAGGAGAWAMGSRGVWACGAGALEQDLNANGHNIVAAASVMAEQTGDPQYRELLVPGSGIKVGNGTAAPYLAIDERANVSGHLNGVINVKAPPYLAKGDGVTDDTNAIQSAINAACASWTESNGQGNVSEVYLPATPGFTSYKVTSPLLLDCGHIKFNGAGWMQTAITQNYLGPTIIAQAAEPGWKPPLTSSVTLTWQASHAYAQYRDLLDSNGNIEVQTAAACTSGAGSHPTWPVAQGGTVADNTCTWQVAMIGTQLVSGAGSSLDAADSEFFNGANTGSNNATTEIMNPASLESHLNGLSHFTVEFYVNSLQNVTTDNLYIVGVHPGQPEQSNAPGMQIWLSGGVGTCINNCISASADIGGTSISMQGNVAGAGVTSGVTHHVALTYDGSTLRLFLDGVLARSSAASGSWTIQPYESFMLSDNGPSVYPGANPGYSRAIGYYDSLRISNIARYTANFTPPTTKLASDGNTVFLENFPTTAPTGTIEGQVGGTTAFIPIETSSGGAEVNPGYIGNLALADNGIWAAWMLNSTIENINVVNAGRTCINLHDNDFQDTIRRVWCVTNASAATHVGFVFGSQSNNNLYEHLQCDGQQTCIEEYGGSGHYLDPDFTDRGQAIYPLAFIQAQAQVDSPWLDIEDSAPNQLATVYSNGAYAPIVIRGGQLTSGATGQAYLAISGGAPFIVAGTEFSGGSPAEAVNVIANPSSPVVMRDVIQPGGIALTNAGKSWWLNESLGSQDLGMKFADLPGVVTNGARRYCTDCDPPANPPVACASAGTKTGAWAHGLNNTWICVP